MMRMHDDELAALLDVLRREVEMVEAEETER